MDWFTPGGLATWGDGRLTILGTDGFIEIRKNIDIAGRPGESHLFIVDQKETRYIDCKDVALPYGSALVVRRAESHGDGDVAGALFPGDRVDVEGAEAGAARRRSRKFAVRSSRFGDGLQMARKRGVPRRVATFSPRRAKASSRHPSSPDFPSIVPSSVLGAFSPANRINIGAIGNGRISRVHDLPGIWKYETARIMAVCDLDGHRAEDARTLVNEYYSKQTGKKYDGVTDVRQLPGAAREQGRRRRRDQHARSLARNHRHPCGPSRQGCVPAEAGVADDRGRPGAERRRPSIGTHLSDWQPAAVVTAVPLRGGARAKRTNRPIADGADRTSGRSGGRSRAGDARAENLNYDMWLGSTPVVPYTEKRVHPQAGYDRPGWLRCEQFGAGMITGWGAHHIDSAHWGMDTEYTGPVEIWGTAEFPAKGLWDVHGPFKTEAMYANGVHMIVSGDTRMASASREATAGSSFHEATRRSPTAIRWRS